MTPQEIKQQFYLLRNGIVADALRPAVGTVHRTIFGLNVPQLKEIAARTGKDAALARSLWADTPVRESVMLAPLLMPFEEMDYDEALQWARMAPTQESADMLCHSLLRHLPQALELANALVDDDATAYCGLRLAANLMYVQPDAARAIADMRPSHPLARFIIEELDFIWGVL